MIKIDKLVAAYTLLEEFLATSRWKLADEHTYDIQLLLVERSEFKIWLPVHNSRSFTSSRLKNFLIILLMGRI